MTSVASNHGSILGIKSPSTHARLHKRGNSGSSASELTSPRAPGRFMPRTAMSSRTMFEEEDQYFSTKSPEVSSPSSGSMKFRPHLRRLGSTKDSNTIDLSLSAAENERLAGLGICDSAWQSSDTVGRYGRNHARSGSNISQGSASSSLHRPSAPYAHPMRQIPRSFTPPICTSFQTGYSQEITSPSEPFSALSDSSEVRGRLLFAEPARRSTSSHSNHLPSPMLRNFTSRSSNHTAGQSQTSLVHSITPPNRRGDRLRSPEMPSSSRSSFDRATSVFRSRDDSLDPMERRAHIQAARQAYREREEAKQLKAERLKTKQLAKSDQKSLGHDGNRRRQFDGPVANSNAVATAVAYEKTEAIASVQPAQSKPPVSAKRAARGPFMRFTIWFRTKLLRLGRSLKVS